MGKTFLMLILFTSLSFAQLIGPKLAVQQSEYDFGDIIQGEVVTHEFVVGNTGDDSLVIKSVRASCGCTAVKPEKDVLNPGESTTIKVSFNTVGRAGKQKKAVYVRTNDKENNEVRLIFTANIVPKAKSEEETTTSQK